MDLLLFDEDWLIAVLTIFKFMTISTIIRVVLEKLRYLQVSKAVLTICEEWAFLCNMQIKYVLIFELMISMPTIFTTCPENAFLSLLNFIPADMCELIFYYFLHTHQNHCI